MATEVRTLDINPTPFFVPPRVGGDREFKGHGPRVASIGHAFGSQRQRALGARCSCTRRRRRTTGPKTEGSCRVSGLPGRAAHADQSDHVRRPLVPWLHRHEPRDRFPRASCRRARPPIRVHRRHIGTRGRDENRRSGALQSDHDRSRNRRRPEDQVDSGRAHAEVHPLAHCWRPGIRRAAGHAWRSQRASRCRTRRRSGARVRMQAKETRPELDRGGGFDELHDLSPRPADRAAHDGDRSPRRPIPTSIMRTTSSDSARAASSSGSSAPETR